VLAQPTTRLLVCDRGTGPGRALKAARRWADALDASVSILGVSSSHSTAATLREALAARQQEHGFPDAEVVVREGDAAEQIVLEQAGSRYDIVVVGVGVLGRPRPGRRRSTAQYLLDRATAPLFIVRGPDASVEKILICTAAGEPSKSCIRVGGWIARRLAAKVALLYVMPGPGEPPAWVRSHLERGLATLRDLEVEGSIRLRAAESPLEGVLAEMTEGGHDLVVVGAARTEARAVFGGSDLTRQVVRRVGKSVLVVPEGAW
jgi:nucleotide-binding universal stress UspA family protein